MRGTKMEKDNEINRDGEDIQEELLDFEFDELSEDKVVEKNGNSLSDDEILELVDIVEPGEETEDLNLEDTAKLLDEEAIEEQVQPGVGPGVVLDELDNSPEVVLDELDNSPEVVLDELDNSPEDREIGNLESDLDSALEGLELSEEGADDFEFLDSAVDTTLEPEQPPKTEEEVLPPVEESVGISEDRIEAIVAKVVQDVVEKVARETMTTVAEKLITDAINALRDSLESSAD